MWKRTARGLDEGRTWQKDVVVDINDNRSSRLAWNSFLGKFTGG